MVTACPSLVYSVLAPGTRSAADGVGALKIPQRVAINLQKMSKPGVVRDNTGPPEDTLSLVDQRGCRRMNSDLFASCDSSVLSG